MGKPKIRFKGYTEDWEQRKVLDLLIQPITDGPHETPKLVEKGVPFISVDAIVDNKILTESVVIYLKSMMSFVVKSISHSFTMYIWLNLVQLWERLQLSKLLIDSIFGRH